MSAQSGFLRIETPRLILRDHVLEDLAEHHALFSDETAMRYLPEVRTRSLEESRENLLTSIRAMEEQPRKFYFLKVIERQSGAHVGEIGYTVLQETPGGSVVNLGYFLRPQMWRKGYAGEAAEALIKYAFTAGDVWRIETGCLAENRGSEGVMKHCGMLREGELVQAVWHEGAWKTRLLYRLLRSEWEEQHEKTGR